MTDTSAFAIRAESLGKRYRIGSKEKPDDTLIGAFTSWARSPLDNFKRVRRLSHFADDGRDSPDVIWALRDTSFEIKHGEVVGLIGRNGAGKSTLLKIVARIVEPTAGRGIINGRVSSLLEVGTGFHPDLTGRENVYLNGVLLGMTKAEMDRKFDAIVDFSGVEKFIDTPVKRYSSGMQVRLAFSVAAHLEPEILLVDEVLAVGDAAFQKKCVGKMEEVAQGGRTIVFVSHNLEAIRQLCHRALYFEGGKLLADGPVDDIAQRYLASLASGSFSFESPDHGFAIQNVVLKNRDGRVTSQFSPGEELVIEIRYHATQRLENPCLTLGVLSLKGTCFTANMVLDGRRPEAFEGTGVISCRFKSLPLLPQDFSVNLSVRAGDANDIIMRYQEVSSFTVTGNLKAYGFRGAFQTVAGSTPVVIPYRWEFPDGRTSAVSLSDPRISG